MANDRLPLVDPYSEIYLRKDRWWGLVREEWLSPLGGAPIKWEEFTDNIEAAKAFHSELAHQYHPNTFVYYGAGDGKQASFETICWAMRRGRPPENGVSPTHTQILNFSHTQVRSDGSNKISIGGEWKFGSPGDEAGFGDASVPEVETSFWELSCEKQDGRGDGTVPVSSGMLPRASGGKKFFSSLDLLAFRTSRHLRMRPPNA